MEHRLAVVGLGYVGIPVAAAFAASGLPVMGIDLDARKVEALQRGVYPIEGDEPELPDLVRAEAASGRLRATTEARAIAEADAILVCVQTPFRADGAGPDYGPLRAALASIGRHLRRDALVVVESTLAPGTMEDIARPALEEASGMRPGPDFSLGHCPERVMPGRLLRNLREYGRVLGGVDARTHDRMRALYSRVVRGSLSPVSLLEAEVVKTFENTYRDVEIGLANEFARYCDALGVDFFTVRREVNKVVDRNLHLPGVGVGGHCIPKDTLLLAHATQGRFRPELMLLARRINDGMPAYTAQRALAALRAGGVDPSKARIAVLGYSYLGESDDVRNTPVEPLLQALQGGVASFVVHDPLAPSTAQRPLERDLASALRGADLAIVATAHAAYRKADLAEWKGWMRTPLLLDGRNCIDRAAARAAGLAVAGIGVPSEGFKGPATT